ncbi:DUF4870 domain-containing protein [Anaeroselena agilis]|uniref:DUF4870 domain-containing protein n=1 Tax=Anaeroselena agilis TaxID=3063788 RepID=A0ABU3P2D3_9FIRM|nr:DUF4870 domain-containing protein [Selenomonadales bacterium 4137-cl]
MNNISGEQKLLAIIAHLSYFFGGLGFIIAPLLIYLLKKEDPFVCEHARQALVAHLALLVAGLVVSLLCAILIGFLLIPVLAVLALILVVTSLIAGLKALNGEYYKYPLIQGLVAKLQ